MFLRLSVCHSVHKLGACVACIAGDMHGKWGHAWQEACVAGGVHDGGGHVWQGGMHSMGTCTVGACMSEGMHAGGTATQVDGTHPTGMHSCHEILIKN